MQENTTTNNLALENVVRDVLTANLKEQRKSRIWSYIFKFSIVIYLLAVLGLTYFSMVKADSKFSFFEEPEHVAMIRLDGDIGETGKIDSKETIATIREAFENPKAQSIVLEINSGGGSSYTSQVIYDEILRLKEKHKKEIVTVSKEVLASGAYYVASATDNIYGQRTTIVGSIGVRMGSFNFSKTIEKLGIERKVISSGENKTIGDPFTEMTKEQEKYLTSMAKQVHDIFITDVKKGRGNRLKGKESELFSGLIWTGDDGIKLGLLDGFYTTQQYVRSKHGDGYIIKDYTREPNEFASLLGGKMSLDLNLKNITEGNLF